MAEITLTDESGIMFEIGLDRINGLYPNPMGGTYLCTPEFEHLNVREDFFEVCREIALACPAAE